MIGISGHEHVDGFERPDVFRAGIRTENWPTREGLKIVPHDEVLKRGSGVSVGVIAAGLAIDIEGRVTDFIEENSVHIEGESRLARADVRIRIYDSVDDGGTEIEYAVEVEGKKLYVRMAEIAVSKFLEGAVPRFAQDYKDNVEHYLRAGLRNAS